MQPWIETDQHKIFYRSGVSPYALISFSHLGFHDLGKTYWGAPVASALDLTCVGIVAKGNNWYPRADLEPIFPRIRAALQDFDDIIVYGASMGGYAALLYGLELGAKTAIAMSPQYSIDPALVPFDSRYIGSFRSDHHGGVGVSSMPKTSYVAYDPFHKIDVANMDLIKKAGPVVEILAPFMDHDSAAMLKGSGLARQMFDAALARRHLDFKRALRPMRKETLVYYRSLAYRGLVLRGSDRWARLGVIEGLKRFPGDEMLTHFAGRLGLELPELDPA